jgi:hypothetical protein
MISFWTRSGWDQQIEREQIMNSTRDFLKKFERSGNKSIDLFLSRSPSHIKMGKTAIIKTIKGCEFDSVFPNDPALKADDWYSHLFHLMSEDFRTPERYFISENNISFITFNYDRSLEYYLHQCLSNSFCEIPEVDKDDEFSKIKFYHVYGKIGRLGFEPQDDKPELDYREKLKDKEYSDFFDSIDIIDPERVQSISDPFISILQNAERIYFLGFDYAVENLEALGVGSEKPLKQNCVIYGTAFNKSELEISVIRKRFEDRGIYQELILDDLRSLEFLKIYVPE